MQKRLYLYCCYYFNRLSFSAMHCGGLVLGIPTWDIKNICGLILSLPSASDILRYILSCRASAICGLPIYLRNMHLQKSFTTSGYSVWRPQNVKIETKLITPFPLQNVNVWHAKCKMVVLLPPPLCNKGSLFCCPFHSAHYYVNTVAGQLGTHVLKTGTFF